jgi:16S rRNA (uracil1498-N3)-methyltransferase
VVLRLADGESVEVFDDAGNVALGVFLHESAHAARVRIETVSADVTSAVAPLRWVVAAAVPKGDRADWMVEKLSELGAEAFIPLAAARSVVLPEGRNKRDRWARLATESAKQSRRRGVMRIEELTSLQDAVSRFARPATKGSSNQRGWYLSIAPQGSTLRGAIAQPMVEPFALFIGPEGGWTADETQTMSQAGLTPVALTPTILRVETAAVAAAAIVAVMGQGLREESDGLL